MARTRSIYNELSLAELIAKKRSARVFIFGSGYSINDISAEEWSKIKSFDTIGFSGSIYLKKVSLTFLLLRAWAETTDGSLSWRNDAEEVISTIRKNEFLGATTFVLQYGLTAIFANRLLGHRIWDEKWPVFLYLSDKVSRLPHRCISDGIVNGKGTLCSAIGLAVGLGYKDIVLAGVDLYDNRYFWIPPDKTLGWSEIEKRVIIAEKTARGHNVYSQHNTAVNGMVELLGEWRAHLHSKFGVSLSVYNNRSLAAATLPVFEW
jgi:hypothetical protein